ncbi:hypothetical protein PPSIR1_32954 [Plesiocystis pacifica SIR-1]|uniref:Lipoprotein n=1 Tax=Plesiocystis pacifica SIR-1 TaxID=391625 RepID=A6GDQ1_9BACT|nr:hypothetical protein [Plesiocystis pacifica]EDM76026.1 hypothetical protein PPSIR1_32954 [Plesiocystis pacifica SIR-1]
MISITLSLVLASTPQVGASTLLDAGLTPAAAEDEVVTTEYWAGHQVAFGTREVPVLGTMQTRMDNYTIARVRKTADGIQIDQRACKVDYNDEGGVKVYVDANVLPDSRLVFERVEGTPHYTMSGTVNWGEEDIDEDGNPGMRVYVDAPVCSGNLHVTNRTTTNARAFPDENGGTLRGEVTISVRQKILGAEGKCLSALAEDSFERSKGSFRYTKIKAGETCKSLLDAGWPVKAK